MINLILFGGLSESGKSHASKYSEKNDFKHMKIIFFEKQIMQYFNIDPLSKEYDPFYELYNRDHDIVFAKLWEEIQLFCKTNNLKNISMDSTTRVDMVDFFQRQEDVNFLSIYFEADFTKRVEREYIKNGKLSLSEVERLTKEKDLTKLSRKADLVKDKSIFVSNNETINEFEIKLSEIFEILKEWKFKQKGDTLFVDEEVSIKYIDNPDNSSNEQKSKSSFAEYSFISSHFIKINSTES